MEISASLLALLRPIAPICLLAINDLTTVHAQSAVPLPDMAAIKQDYRRPLSRPIENQALVDLGRDLFFAPQLSASCARQYVLRGAEQP